MISSTVVDSNPSHDKIRVYNRGALAGTLTVVAGDGRKIAERLDESISHLRIEPARETHLMASVNIVRVGAEHGDDRESVWIEVVNTGRGEHAGSVLLRIGSIRWAEDGVGHRGPGYLVRAWPDRAWDSAGKVPRIELVEETDR